MRTCPKCKLDYANEFTYCEFDGYKLIETSPILSEPFSLKNPFRFLSASMQSFYKARKLLFSALLLLLISFPFLYSSNKSPDRLKTNSNKQEPLVIETPKVAIDYSEDPSTDLQAHNQKPSTPDQPGVKVYLPPSPQSDTNNTREPQPTKPNSPPAIRVESTGNSKPQINAHQPQPPSPIKSSTTYQPNEPRNSQVVTSSNTKTSPPGSAGVPFRLLSSQSRNGSQGVFYQMAFQIGNESGRLIHWDYLMITVSLSSGKTINKAIPLTLATGSPGKATFTITTPSVPYSSNGLMQFRLLGQNIDNQKVIASTRSTF
ncbi:MAG: hypothetical protein AB1757_19420 [Acidobacteriota bacterium]